MFKKMLGVLQVIFSSTLLGLSVYTITVLRDKVQSLLQSLSQVDVSRVGPEILNFFNLFIKSEKFIILLDSFSIFLGIIGLLFLLQGIVNILSDQKKMQRSKEEKKKDILQEKEVIKDKKAKSEFKLGDEY